MEIYSTTVKAIGKEAKSFQDQKMLILFGENAPIELRDYCFNIEVKGLEEPIAKAMTIFFDEQIYKITAVGTHASKTLATLGHLTITFDGKLEQTLPGTLHLEDKTYPIVEVGTVIRIASDD